MWGSSAHRRSEFGEKRCRCRGGAATSSGTCCALKIVRTAESKAQECHQRCAQYYCYSGPELCNQCHESCWYMTDDLEAHCPWDDAPLRLPTAVVTRLSTSVQRPNGLHRQGPSEESKQAPHDLHTNSVAGGTANKSAAGSTDEPRRPSPRAGNGCSQAHSQPNTSWLAGTICIAAALALRGRRRRAGAASSRER